MIGVVRRIALMAAALGALAIPAGAAADDTVWLCKPGLADNPCRVGLDTTRISPAGDVLDTTTPKRRRAKVDCVYVYPTVSDDPGPNSDLSIDPEERSIALYQAARYSQRCRVFAPMYRQITLAGIGNPALVTPETELIAYRGVVAAWKTYLRKYNHGRGVILIGHSPGTFLLRQLISDHVDRRPGVRKRLISALLLGGNVEVVKGKLVGGDFRHVPGCRRPAQLGCAVAFSTFGSPPPPESNFGRVGGALSTGDPAKREILCTNPTVLDGPGRETTTIFPSEPFAPGTTIGGATEAVGVPRPPVSTTWLEAPDDYNASCISANDAHVLLISPLDGAPTLNAVPDATWGLHLVDANIALGNLLDVVRAQTRAYLARARAG
jgi:hypothetical protein